MTDNQIKDFSQERVRYLSFYNWPRTDFPTPSMIADTGFYYQGFKDEVECFSCHLKVSNWTRNMNPTVIHKNLSPNCLMCMQKTSKISTTLSNNDTNQATDMYSETARLESYKTWPKESIISPLSLARSGLYYTGQDDLVECIFCHGKLKGWRMGNIAHNEHLKHFGKRCSFVKNMDIKMNINKYSTIGQDQEKIKQKETLIDHNTQTYNMNNKEKDEEHTVEEIMNSDVVKQILSFGVSRKILQKASHDICIEKTKIPDITTLLDKCSTISMNWSQPQKNLEKIEMKKEHSPENEVDFENKYKELQESRKCKICLIQEINVVFLPCGHLISCLRCARAFYKCPICRCNINKVIKTFLS